MVLPKDPIKAAAYRENARLRQLGKKHKPETIAKMREAQSGERNPNYGGNPEMIERCKGMARKRIGTKASDDTRKKMTASQKKRYENHPELIEVLRESKMGEKNHNFGKQIADDVKVKMSLAKQGPNHFNYGKHLSEETREKIRIANSGENCYHFGQSPSDETRHKMSEALRGDKCYKWKGGITALNHAIRCSLENRDWIMAVFKRDAFTCQDCGATKVYLHAHHIKPFAEIMRENEITTIEEARACAALWDVANGKSLCEDCHRVIHFGEPDEETAPEVAELAEVI